jgi:hypothetical protein
VKPFGSAVYLLAEIEATIEKSHDKEEPLDDDEERESSGPS